jgi:predicted nucleic acid-binding protein
VNAKIGTLVCDANILIDYFDNNKNVLRSATEHCYEIYVPYPVFNEVEQMKESDAEKLGIRLIEPTFEQLMEAANDEGKQFQDYRRCHPRLHQ